MWYTQFMYTNPHTHTHYVTSCTFMPFITNIYVKKTRRYSTLYTMQRRREQVLLECHLKACTVFISLGILWLQLRCYRKTDQHMGSITSKQYDPEKLTQKRYPLKCLLSNRINPITPKRISWLHAASVERAYQKHAILWKWPLKSKNLKSSSKTIHADINQHVQANFCHNWWRESDKNDAWYTWAKMCTLRWLWCC